MIRIAKVQCIVLAYYCWFVVWLVGLLWFARDTKPQPMSAQPWSVIFKKRKSSELPSITTTHNTTINMAIEDKLGKLKDTIWRRLRRARRNNNKPQKSTIAYFSAEAFQYLFDIITKEKFQIIDPTKYCSKLGTEWWVRKYIPHKDCGRIDCRHSHDVEIAFPMTVQYNEDTATLALWFAYTDLGTTF